MNSKNKLLSIICWLVILISTVNIIGWLADIEILKAPVSDLPSMKFNTAVCTILCGVSILLFENNKKQHFNTIIPLNLMVLIISLLTLIEYVFKINLKIDEFLVHEERAISSPGRMAVTSACCLTLLATGFSFVIVQTNNLFNVIARVFFYVVTVITVLTIAGYMFNVPRLHSLYLSKSMALVTAVVLLPLSLVYASLIPPQMGKLHLAEK